MIHTSLNGVWSLKEEKEEHQENRGNRGEVNARRVTWLVCVVVKNAHICVPVVENVVLMLRTG